jgi:hypothetical protein
VHEDWKNCSTVEELAQGLTNNASAGASPAMLQDVRECLARAGELAITLRPIESAPKDGTSVILYAPAEYPCFVQGFWDDTWGGWEYREQLVKDVNTGNLEPAGWLPLPKIGSLPAPVEEAAA